MKTVRDFLRSHVLRKDEVDAFLDPASPNWAQFDPELGYTLRSSFVRDGMDHSYTIATYGPLGERRTMNYAERPCRIHAYGNSYTQCHQVSDAETWEEYLAGHLGEPIRNFGVGGYGVYQAYRRMARIESGEHGAPYVLFNVFAVDDHYRSLDAWRRLRCGTWFRDYPVTMFHANPWDHVRINPETGGLEERHNLCPTPESLYRLCDPAFVVETFTNDLPVHLYLGQDPAYRVDMAMMEPLANLLHVELETVTPEARAASVRRLYLAAGLHATEQILEWARAFCENHGKELLVMLTYGNTEIYEACAGKARYDQALLEAVREKGLRLLDMRAEHARDYGSFAISPAAYMERFCIPHYNPAGNHFMAYRLKDLLVDWLDPPPATYPGKGTAMGFAHYLPGAETPHEPPVS